jgi:hypothetical protein
MEPLRHAREAITSAGEAIGAAMRVAIISCLLSAAAVVMALLALTRHAPAPA